MEEEGQAPLATLSKTVSFVPVLKLSAVKAHTKRGISHILQTQHSNLSTFRPNIPTRQPSDLTSQPVDFGVGDGWRLLILYAEIINEFAPRGECELGRT
jgi:hypothetical protein